jgi:hypothetical protein
VHLVHKENILLAQHHALSTSEAQVHFNEVSFPDGSPTEDENDWQEELQEYECAACVASL